MKKLLIGLLLVTSVVAVITILIYIKYKSSPGELQLADPVNTEASSSIMHQSNTQSPEADSQSSGVTTQAPFTTQVPKITSSDQQLRILNITGSSNKLTSSQIKNMQKWRETAYQYAKANPDTVYLNGQSTEKCVALTFDDGPDNKITPMILDILKKYNVKGNFFFIGENINSFSKVVKRADAEGNLVLSHGWQHNSDEMFEDISSDQMMKEIRQTSDAIYNIIGKRPNIVRSPFGSINDNVISTFKKNNLKLALWSIDTLDWSQREKDNIVKNVMDNVRSGDIILMHSNSDKTATAEALPILIEKLQTNGYQIVTLDKLLNVTALSK